MSCARYGARLASTWRPSARIRPTSTASHAPAGPTKRPPRGTPRASHGPPVPAAGSRQRATGSATGPQTLARSLCWWSVSRTPPSVRSLVTTLRGRSSRYCYSNSMENDINGNLFCFVGRFSLANQFDSLARRPGSLQRNSLLKIICRRPDLRIVASRQHHVCVGGGFVDFVANL